MSQIKITAYNEKVQTAMEALLESSVELKGKAVVDFECTIGEVESIYSMLNKDATVTFKLEDIVVTNEAGESITLEALHNYVYTVTIDGAEHTFVMNARSKQLSAVQVAEHIFAILLNAKKVELGLGKKVRQPSESRVKNEKLKAEKLLLAQLRAKQKADKQAKVAVPADETL